MRTAYFDMFSGVSGDMVLGALVDCGVPLELLSRTVEALGLQEVHLESAPGKAHGIAATRVRVHSHEHHPHRSFGTIRGMIEGSSLPAEVKERAVAVFRRLGEAEARVHGVPLEQIHFHEVGAVDSITDIVGAVAGFHHLGVERWFAGPFRVGTGFVECAHGRLPLPAPATQLLLEGCPVERTAVPCELTTPTGAALVTTLVRPEDFQPAIAQAFDRIGYGQGERELPDRPNLLRLLLGSQAECGHDCGGAVVLESNIDDMNPQFYDYLMDRLFQAGAFDVFLAPVQMKKNRPGVLLRVITDDRRLAEISRLVLSETTSIGVRWHRVERATLERRAEEVETPWGRLRVKRVVSPEGLVTLRPEFDDLKRTAAASGLPLPELTRRVERLLEREQDSR